MKQTRFALILAVLIAPLAAAAWAATPTCSTPGLATSCPGKSQANQAVCPRNGQQPRTALCAVGNAPCGDKQAPCGPSSPRVMIKEKGGWKLVAHILQPGSRSQGYHGELYNGERRVEGKKGEVLETPFGKVVWRGKIEERIHLWDTTGWVPEEKNLFKEEAIPNVKPQTSREELGRQIDGEIGNTSE